MSNCIQCGAPLTLAMAACPRCARPVGESSVGRARERAARPVARKVLAGAAGLVVLAVLVQLAVTFARGRKGLSGSALGEIATTAASSLVRVEGAGGVVVRAIDGMLVVVTQAAAAPPGREVTVTREGRTARGFGLLVGEGRVADEFALVLVPDGAALGAREAKLAGNLSLDQPLAALGAEGRAVGAGTVLSLEDGILVHDAPTDGADRGAGLWSAQGRLAALPAMGKGGADHLAVVAAAVFERMLLHSLPVPAAVEWAELPVPVSAGARVAVVYGGAGAEALAARVGDKGKVTKGRAVGTGLHALDLTSPAAGLLQVGGPFPASAGARATVVTLGRF